MVFLERELMTLLVMIWIIGLVRKIIVQFLLFVFDMSSSTVEAQKLANQANVQNTRETNQANRDIAAAQNDLNYKMFNEQNEWNLQQWERENEYNSPKQQVQRYIEAGINPLWAIGNGDPGKAQQLKSADYVGAVGATMVPPQVMPEYDPSRLGSIVAAAQNVSNSLQGFMKLGLESVDVDTRRRASDSQIALNRAESLFKRSQTAGQDILNNLNTRTFDVQVSTKVSEYESILAKIRNTDSGTDLNKALEENARTTKDQIIAQTRYVNRQADAILDQVAQAWTNLRIQQQRADTDTFTARSQSYYEGENLKIRSKEFQFQRDKIYADYKHLTNKELLDIVDKQRSEVEKRLGITFSKTDDANALLIERTKIVGDIISKRLESEPSEQNVRSYQEYLDAINSFPIPSSVPPAGNASFPSILNPSQSWNQ